MVNRLLKLLKGMRLTLHECMIKSWTYLWISNKKNHALENALTPFLSLSFQTRVTLAPGAGLCQDIILPGRKIAAKVSVAESQKAEFWLGPIYLPLHPIATTCLLAGLCACPAHILFLAFLCLRAFPPSFLPSLHTLALTTKELRDKLAQPARDQWFIPRLKRGFFMNHNPEENEAECSIRKMF